MKIHLLLITAFFFSGCTLTTRYVTQTIPNSHDVFYKSRDRDTIRKSVTPFYFIDDVKDKNTMLKGRTIRIGNSKKVHNLEEVIAEKGRTLSFMIIRNDTVLYEKYFPKRGGAMDKPVNVMSVTKSFIATLVGMAIQEGKIRSIKDYAHDYIPELKQNKKLQKLTLEELINMRASLKYHEIGGMIFPFSRVVKIYYGKDIEKELLKRSKSKNSPNKYFHYQSPNTSLLAIVLERATGKRLNEYFEEKMWKKMGMQYDSYFTVDDTEKRTHRSFCCFAATTKDLAKLGKFYLEGGKWNGEQLVPEWFVKNVTTLTKPMNGFFYSYFYRHNRDWTPLKEWEAKNGKFDKNDDAKELIRVGSKLLVAEPKAEDDQDFYAEGLLGNYIYVHPKTNTIIVRTANQATLGGVSWPELMRAIVKNEDHIKNKYYTTLRLREVKRKK